MQPRRSWIALVAGLVALAIPASATAATQIGQTFNATGGGPGPGFTLLQSTSPLGQYAAPFAGVITSWSYQAAASSAPQLEFKAARRLARTPSRSWGKTAREPPPRAP